jgi:hypothetical protein
MRKEFVWPCFYTPDICKIVLLWLKDFRKISHICTGKTGLGRDFSPVRKQFDVRIHEVAGIFRLQAPVQKMYVRSDED